MTIRPILLAACLALSAAAPAVARQPATSEEDRRIQAAGLLVRGLTRSFLGDETGALDLLERAAALAPQDAALQSALATSSDRLGQTARALAHARRAHELAPDRAEFAVVLARLLGTSGDAASALGVMERVVADHPDRPDLALERARLLSALEQRTAAWEAYRDLVRDPQAPDPVIEEAYRVAMDVGFMDEALALTGTLLDRHPADAGIVRRRGELLVRMGREDEARAAFERAVALDPEDREARAALAAVRAASDAEAPDVVAARSLIVDGRFGEAARRLSAIVDADPARLDAWNLLLVAHRAEGDPGAALERAGEASLFFPGDPGLALQSGLAALEALRPDDAFAAFERVLFLEGESGAAGSARATIAAAAGAVALDLSGNSPTMLTDLFDAFAGALDEAGVPAPAGGASTPFERLTGAGRTAEALDEIAAGYPTVPLALVAAGDALSRAGRTVEARARWSAAEAIAPGNPVTRARLAR